MTTKSFKKLKDNLIAERGRDFPTPFCIHSTNLKSILGVVSHERLASCIINGNEVIR